MSSRWTRVFPRVSDFSYATRPNVTKWFYWMKLFLWNINISIIEWIYILLNANTISSNWNIFLWKESIFSSKKVHLHRMKIYFYRIKINFQRMKIYFHRIEIYFYRTKVYFHRILLHFGNVKLGPHVFALFRPNPVPANNFYSFITIPQCSKIQQRYCSVICNSHDQKE